MLADCIPVDYAAEAKWELCSNGEVVSADAGLRTLHSLFDTFHPYHPAITSCLVL